MSSTVTPLCLTQSRHKVFQSKLRVSSHSHKVAEEMEIEIDILLPFLTHAGRLLRTRKLLTSCCAVCVQHALFRYSDA